MKHDNTNTQTEDDDAVSPVIGVILMVAITVILAAVIGTFVLGLGSNVQENVQAGVNVNYEPSKNQVAATYVSAQNAEMVNVTFQNTIESVSVKGNLSKVGDKLTLSGDVGPTGTWVNSTGDACIYPEGDFPNSTASCGSANLDSNWVDGDEVGITVVAVKGDQSTVVLTKQNTL